MKKQSESGQILVVFAIALVALLGFTSLAVDVGMTYADRRYNQSNADTASLAGGGAVAQYLDDHGISWDTFSRVCNSYNVVVDQGLINAAFNAANSRAAANKVVNLETNITHKHGIVVTCVNDPNHFERHIDVQTMVTSKVTTMTIQLFFGGEVKNTVNAVVRVHPRTELAYGRAIVSLSNDCHQGGVTFDGNNIVNINGGGVFSNSCIDVNGSKVNVEVMSGDIQYTSGYTNPSGATVNPTPSQSSQKMPIMQIDPPSCGNGPVKSITNGGTIDPGNYSKIKLTGGTLHLNPGLYCMSGDVDLSGSATITNDPNEGGVTLYMMANGSSLKITGGNTHVVLSAPTSDAGGGIDGILIYLPDSNTTGSVDMEGDGSSSYTGAVYGRYTTIDVGGNSGINPTFHTQLIGNYVKVHGNSEIDINYSSDKANTVDPQLDMMQ